MRQTGLRHVSVGTLIVENQQVIGTCRLINAKHVEYCPGSSHSFKYSLTLNHHLPSAHQRDN